jgi:hypothetical protein
MALVKPPQNELHCKDPNFGSCEKTDKSLSRLALVKAQCVKGKHTKNLNIVKIAREELTRGLALVKAWRAKRCVFWQKAGRFCTAKRPKNGSGKGTAGGFLVQIKR